MKAINMLNEIIMITTQNKVLCWRNNDNCIQSCKV